MNRTMLELKLTAFGGLGGDVYRYESNHVGIEIFYPHQRVFPLDACMNRTMLELKFF